MASLNLSSLGLELDAVRRSRAARDPLTGRQSTSAGDLTDESLSSASDSSPEATHSVLDDVAPATAPVDQPYPLCLLCFTRSPSAVLLPCCHLNLCYLCAPLLIHNGAAAARQQARRDTAAELRGDLPITNSAQGGIARARGDAHPAAPDESPVRTASRVPVSVPAETETRVPFNVALTRAVQSNPRARRLSIGGYVPPPQGVTGGEMRGLDILPPRGRRTTSIAEDACGGDGDGAVGTSGISASVGEDGRVALGLSGRGAGATCLVCRAEVSGWLRVYTG